MENNSLNNCVVGSKISFIENKKRVPKRNNVNSSRISEREKRKSFEKNVDTLINDIHLSEMGIQITKAKINLKKDDLQKNLRIIKKNEKIPNKLTEEKKKEKKIKSMQEINNQIKIKSKNLKENNDVNKNIEKNIEKNVEKNIKKPLVNEINNEKVNIKEKKEKINKNNIQQIEINEKNNVIKKNDENKMEKKFKNEKKIISNLENDILSKNKQINHLNEQKVLHLTKEELNKNFYDFEESCIDDYRFNFEETNNFDGFNIVEYMKKCKSTENNNIIPTSNKIDN